MNQRLKEGPHRLLELRVAERQRSSGDRFVDFAPHKQKPGGHVTHFDQPAPLAEHQLLGSRQHVNGQFAFSLLGVDPGHQRQVVAAQTVDVVGLKGDVGIDPERFEKPLRQSVADHLVATLVDGRVTPRAPHLVPSPLQLPGASSQAGAIWLPTGTSTTHFSRGNG